MSAAYDAAVAHCAGIHPVLAETERRLKAELQSGTSITAVTEAFAAARIAAMRELFGPGKRWTWKDAADYYSHVDHWNYRKCRAEAVRKAKVCA